MSERRSGLLLVGPDKLGHHTFGNYQWYFENAGVNVQHPFKIDSLPDVEDVSMTHTEEARHAYAIAYSRRAEATPIERQYGSRFVEDYLGRVATRAAALLVLNLESDGDIEPKQGDFTRREWAQLMSHGNPDGLFFINTIPKSSGYANYTAGENDLPSPRVVGGRLEVVTNRIYEVEGRRRWRKK